MATGSADQSVMLWRVVTSSSQASAKSSSAICLLKLEGSEQLHMIPPKEMQKRTDEKEEGEEEKVETKESCEQGHGDCINAVAFHRNGLVMGTCSSDRTAKLWLARADLLRSEVFAPRCFATLKGHTARVSSVSFHPDDLIVSTGSDDLSVRLWSMDLIGITASCVAVFACHMDRITSVAFCPWAGNILAAGSTCTQTAATLWSLNSNCSAAFCSTSIAGDERSPIKSLRGVLTIAFHPSAPVFVTGSEDNTLTLWQ
jgi:WD40 repeat protein